FIRQSTQSYMFHLDLNIPPSSFTLIEPANGALLERQPGEDIVFSWNASSTPYPSNPITYTMEYSTTMTFDPPTTTTVLGISGLSHTVSVDVLTFETDYFWRITAVDGFGLTNESFIRKFTPTQGTCCFLAGDADDSGTRNIGDVTFLIAFIFTGGGAPPCIDSGDADGSNTINIADVTYMIAFIFSGGPDPICGTTGS
ncbi:MAG: hypothetical protein ACE5IR_28410, partial [bacterium]